MRMRNRIWSQLAVCAMTGGMLMQIGPCTGDELRNAVSSGARATLNGLFGVITDTLVTNVFNLP